MEVIKRENLLEAAMTEVPTEFISYFVRKGKIVKLEPRESICRPYRLTLDYPADGLLLNAIFRRLGDFPTVDAICTFLDINPQYLRINKLPDISFYTCVKDGEKYIQQTINSVLAQGIHDFEYIIVDDYSIDNTLDEILKIQDPRIKLVLNETNLGLASSSNIAINMAMGKYVMRVDADDLLVPLSVGPLVNYADTHGLNFVYPSYMEINEKGKVITSGVKGGVKVHAGCALMRRSVINEIRFKSGIKHWDSLELFKRIEGSEGIDFYNTQTFFYRVRKDSMSHAVSKERDEVLKSFNA